MITSLDVKTIQKMFLLGAKSLEDEKDYINELNVFPVPDGDTGTNMTMTIMSAAKEVAALEEVDMKTLSKAISSGSLRGARGNSGVILSQLFRGFTKEMKQHEAIDAVVISNACDRAVESAYKAVMKPKEGTILTVAKAIADKAKEVVLETDDIEVILDEIIKEGDYALSQTPELLPVLKQAGVVDSGGQGLMQVLKGMNEGLKGKDIDIKAFLAGDLKKESKKAGSDYNYKINFIVRLNENIDYNKENEYKEYLSGIGSNVEVSASGDVLKTKMFTNKPGEIITKALSFGDIMKFDFESLVKDSKNNNGSSDDAMKAKYEASMKAEEKEEKEVGFIAVSIGDGMNEILKGLGVDEVIEGGQTMNPSTEDVINAISKVNAKTIYVLPNNKNIVLAANQAASLVKEKNIVVIPSKNVPQGIAAIVSYVQGQDAETNKKHMIEDMENIKTGSVTYAVRDTVIDDKEIKENNIMGIGDSGILSVGEDVLETTLDMISELVDEDSEILSIYYGEDVTEENIEELQKAIGEKFPDVEVDVNYGGQPIYYYVISVE